MASFSMPIRSIPSQREVMGRRCLMRQATADEALSR
jgi:hypothetical protein